MPDSLSPGHGQRDEGLPPSGDSPRGGRPSGDSPRGGRPRHVPDEPGAGDGNPPPSLEQPTAGAPGAGLTPGDLDGPGGLDHDCWDQEAALAACMADMESGLDLFSSGIGLEPDEDWPPGEPDGPPSSDVGSVAMPAGEQPADGARTVPAAAVPECLDAGFFPRGGLGPGPGAGGSGFASGDVLDTALPSAVVAGLLDAAAGTSRGYKGLDDDELIGALIAWQRTEAWVAAGKLSAVAELIPPRVFNLLCKRGREIPV